MQQLQLLDFMASPQVSSTLFRLKQRNTYQGSTSHMWLKSMANLSQQIGHSSSFDPFVDDAQESGFRVTEIVENLRAKIQRMVDVAMQASKAIYLFIS